MYVGSWDDNFYAVDLATGKLRWKTRVKSQNGVQPYPGEVHRDLTSDGGLITSSAWFEPAAGSAPRPRHLRRRLHPVRPRTPPPARCTGSTTTRVDPTSPPDPTPTAPASSRRRWSTTASCSSASTSTAPPGYRGYIVGASLATGDPVWEYQTDVNAQGARARRRVRQRVVVGDRAPRPGLVVYGTADCDFSNAEPLAESVLALHMRDRHAGLACTARPLPDLALRLGLRGHRQRRRRRARATRSFLGRGLARTAPTTRSTPPPGALRWKTNVVFGGFSGGFIATTAYDGTRRLRGHGHRRLRPVREQRPSRSCATRPTPRHAVAGALRPRLRRRAPGPCRGRPNAAASFAPTTVAGGMTFDGLALAAAAVQVRDAARRARLIAQVKLPQANWSGIATVGDALVLGLGSTYSPEGGRHRGPHAGRERAGGATGPERPDRAFG